MTLQRLAKCYRPFEEKGRGWCATNMLDDLVHPQFDVEPEHGWGFCSDECYPDMSEPFYGKAREKLVDVLSEEHCEMELTQNGTKAFNHKPEVLCVGLNQSYNIRVYIRDTQGNYHHVPDDVERYQHLLRLEQMWYIVGPGSCHGDSGGPAFQPALQMGQRIYVVVGITSSGTSSIGHCGGINNPTHYTRLKKVASWITTYVNEDDICWAGADAKPAPFE